jgi:hypothetical protein
MLHIASHRCSWSHFVTKFFLKIVPSKEFFHAASRLFTKGSEENQTGEAMECEVFNGSDHQKSHRASPDCILSELGIRKDQSS